MALPDSYASAASYQASFLAALTEEVNLRLAESARRFHAAVRRCVPSQLVEAMPVTLASGLRAAEVTAAASQLAAACSREGLVFIPACSLSVRQPFVPGAGKAAAAAKKRQHQAAARKKQNARCVRGEEQAGP